MSNMKKKYEYIVSFPHLGNYCYPIYNLLDKLVDKKTTKVLMPDKITSSTIQKGANASPDFVCVPFKYNMGNYIESLEKGANVLMQAGGGCRFGYYSEVQEQILKDMGYNFTYISLLGENGINIFYVYKKFRMLNKKLSFIKFAYHFLLAIKMINILDEFETYIRDSISFEVKKGEFERIHKGFLKLLTAVSSFGDGAFLKKHYYKILNNVELDKSNDDSKIKIGIVGELFTCMEPSSSFFMEKELSKLNSKVKRYTTVTYLLFKKTKSQKKLLNTSKEYVKYKLGADGLESVAHTLELIETGYDGIIHSKPFGCSPEINAIPILQKISSEKNIPIMYLTFDAQTSQTGVKTRLEAFYDMLLMKKQNTKSPEYNFEDVKKEVKKYKLRAQN